MPDAPLIGADALEERPHVVAREVEEQLQPAARRRSFGVGRRRIEDRRGPWGGCAVVGDATVEIDAAEERVLAEVAELNAGAAALSIDDAFGSRFGFGACTPGRGVVRLRRLTVGRIGHFGNFATAGLVAPRNPTRLLSEGVKGHFPSSGRHPITP